MYEEIKHRYKLGVLEHGEQVRELERRTYRLKPEMLIDNNNKVWWDYTDILRRSLEAGENAKLVIKKKR